MRGDGGRASDPEALGVARQNRSSLPACNPMNADDKAHWLSPSPPLAVDDVPTRATRSEARPRPVPPEVPEILPSDREAGVPPRPGQATRAVPHP
jgi:hypothetical protein